MSEQHSTIQQSQRAGQAQNHAGEPSLLRLLRTSGEHGLIDGELRQELERLFELLYRIDQLLDRSEQSPAGGNVDVPANQPVADEDLADQHSPPSASDKSPEGNDEIQIGGHILAFDPAEFARPPLAASPVRRPEVEPTTTPLQTPPAEPSMQPVAPGETTPAEYAAVKRLGQYQTLRDAGDDQVERWWVNFNGDVSLERLARFRHVLGESPFAIEARFDEITDGLIVLRIVTDHKLTEAHVDWIVRQVMISVGLNRDAAILSSRKEKPGGHRWDSTEIL